MPEEENRFDNETGGCEGSGEIDQMELVELNLSPDATLEDVQRATKFFSDKKKLDKILFSQKTMYLCNDCVEKFHPNEWENRSGAMVRHKKPCAFCGKEVFLCTNNDSLRNILNLVE